jgi:hypothetical protein
MDTYEWQKNFAIVNRLYYTERLWETTLFATGLYTWANIMFMRKGYFANTMKQRIAPIWLKMFGLNSAVTFILIKPLQKEEIDVQVKKRFIMGKWLYSTFHLETENQKYGDFRIC